MNWKAKLCSIVVGIALLIVGCRSGSETPTPPETQTPNITPTVAPQPDAIPDLLSPSGTEPLDNPPSLAVLFLIDSSLSVRELCSPEEQALASQVPGMTISLFKGLSSYYRNEELLKVGVLAFTSRIETDKSPFPIKNALAFSDNFINEYAEYIKRYNEEGNNFRLALQTGKELLNNLQANKKLLVLITDGWFIEAETLRDETESELDKTNNDGIQLLLLRLNCPIDPTNQNLQKRFQEHDKKQQNKDNAVWDYHIQQGRMFKSEGSNSLIKSLFDYSDIHSLIPTDQSGWWDGNSNEKIPVDLPGDTWKVKIGIASIGLDNIKFVDKLDSEVDEFYERHPYFMDIKFKGPNPNCGEYKGLRYLLPKKHGQETPLIFYWVARENLDKYFSLSVSPNREVLIINNEPVSIKVGPIAPVFPNGDESFLECYQLWVSLTYDEKSALTPQTREPISFDDATHEWDIQVAMPDPPFYEPKELFIYVDIVKFSQDKARFGALNREAITTKVRFRPGLVNHKGYSSSCDSDVEKVLCSIFIEYSSGDYYPNGITKVDPDIFALSESSSDCDEFPSPYEFREGTAIIPLRFDRIDLGYEKKSIIEKNLTKHEITIPKKATENCGVKGVLIRWEKPANDQVPWKTIVCPLEGKCEETDRWGVP